MTASQKQIRERRQHMHLAAVFRQAPQPCLLEAKLLFDHPEGMLPFGPEVGLRCLHRIATRKSMALPFISGRLAIPW
jgi:hypothetical protein